MTAMDADLTGTVFGSRYRLLRVIGEGGMAAVYEAHDDRSGDSVAVKVLRSELTRMVGEDRFTREIRVAQQLDHPNIVPLLDSGVQDHLSYFVMPFVRGGTLRQRIAEQAQLTVEETLSIARAIASALAHAHKSGIVHRDIKPENVLLDASQVYDSRNNSTAPTKTGVSFALREVRATGPGAQKVYSQFKLLARRLVTKNVDGDAAVQSCAEDAAVQSCAGDAG